MHLPPFKVGNLVAKIPIVQGGMAIRISTGALAGAVAATGAIGVIGASGMELDEFVNEIKIARDLAKGGIVGANIMFAAREYVSLVQTAIKEGIDIIFTGAGFSRDAFKLVQGTKTLFIPIVSSLKLALISEKLGACAIVVESGEAGGHLGTDQPLSAILPEIRASVKIPIIAGGGVIDGKGICEVLKMGADAVQIATRFVLTEECNAAKQYKEVYQRAKKEDVVLITSPVGLPGRAIKTELVNKILAKTAPKPMGCDFCLKSCSLEYCIIQALLNALHGDVKHGVVFSGANVWKIKDRTIKPAAKIIEELVREAEVC